uniref:histidine kinase n=1 Tax=Chromera velia CCMP2878 TaxID=1169474 RepID=A0A0G4HGU6_9ALVE|eukprot:Cvel_27395.t1-p1 / transcript=Cvel_27395.t1 / gene=Cvel_27395 / organism=Chromera_velia_CCMP2878 / gene_product=Hybrid signal transduction histidine kinase G, putative / transcript_product=Hybrid signal transduction histidine kinase G, putative / location=Cvel_scaffold3413:1608-4589(+) / protein_length=856 / sequence_SO=supercontig / SO=protein_coding / is_pseudo=false
MVAFGVTMATSFGHMDTPTCLLLLGGVGVLVLAVSPTALQRFLSNKKNTETGEASTETSEAVTFYCLSVMVVAFRIAQLTWKAPNFAAYCCASGYASVMFKPFVQTLHLSDSHFWCINVLDSASWWATTALVLSVIYPGEDAQSVGCMWFLLCIFAVSPIRHSSIFRSLTSLTLAEAEKEMCLRAETEKGRDNFVSYIMHEMRNPLYGASLLVVEYLETLAELSAAARVKTQNQTSLTSLQAVVQEGCGRLEQLTGFLSAQFDKMRGVCDDVLQLKKLEKGGFEYVFQPADIRQWVSKLAAQVAPLFDNKRRASAKPAAEDQKRGELSEQGDCLANGNRDLKRAGGKTQNGLGTSMLCTDQSVSFSWSFECTPEAETMLRDRPFGVADFSRLDQVVSNFISNAKKFTKKGGVFLRCMISEVPYKNSNTAPESELSGTKEKEKRSQKVTESEANAVLSGSQNTQWQTALELERNHKNPDGDDKGQVGEGGVPSHQSESPSSPPLPCVTMRIEVTDTGPGLSADDIGKLFQPYGQVRAGEMQNGGGTGLGLVICKSLVEAHSHGMIGVESEGRGEGSTFFFQVCLPLLTGLSAQPQETEAVRSADSIAREEKEADGTYRSKAVPLCEEDSRRSSLSLRQTHDRFPSGSCGGAITPPRRMSEVAGVWGSQAELPACRDSINIEKPRRKEADSKGPTTASSHTHSSHLVPNYLPSSLCDSGGLTADVLIVDDDRFCLMACAAAIRRLGLTVKGVEDGDEAVDLIVSGGESFRVVLTDKNMERVDGPEAVRQLCAHFESLPKGGEGWVIRPDGRLQCVPSIVGVTGDTLEETREDFARAGAERVVLKPLKVEDLKGLLQFD